MERGRGRGRGGAPRGRGGDRGRGRGRGGGGAFRKSGPDDPRISSEVQIFVEGLPTFIKVPELVQYFSSVGEIKMDRDSKKPRVWLYTDKVSGQPTGEATITYKIPASQKLALETFHQQMYQGRRISVTPSIVKPHMATIPELGDRGRGRGAARGRGRSGMGRGERGRGVVVRERSHSGTGGGYGSDGSYGGGRGGGWGSAGTGEMMGNRWSVGEAFVGNRVDLNCGPGGSVVGSRVMGGFAGPTNNPPPLFGGNYPGGRGSGGNYPVEMGSGLSAQDWGRETDRGRGGSGFTRGHRYQPY